MAEIYDSLFFPENIFDVSSSSDEESGASFDFEGAVDEHLARTSKRARIGNDQGSGRGTTSSDDEEDYEEEEDGSFDKKKNQRRRRTDTMERKERNRLRARDARKRKQEHMAKLQAELEALKDANVKIESKLKQAHALEESKHDQWFAALQLVLGLRAQAEENVSAWLQLVDPGFVVCHPITPYRSYKRADVLNNRLVLMGIDDAIADSVSLQVCLSTLCRQAVHVGRDPKGPDAEDGALHKSKRSVDLANGAVKMRFLLNRAEAHFGPHGLMCPFEMRTENLMSHGLLNEVTKQGLLKVAFVPAPHPSTGSTSRFDFKLKQLDLFFDAIAFWRQMQSARGAPSQLPVTPRPAAAAPAAPADVEGGGGGGAGAAAEAAGDKSAVACGGGGASPASVFGSAVVPNTIQAALRPSEEARVITEATAPFRITHVNDAWTSLCGFTGEEAVGKTLGCLQGDDTDFGAVSSLVKDCKSGRPSSMEVTNYDKKGLKFRNFLQTFPLSGGDATPAAASSSSSSAAAAFSTSAAGGGTYDCGAITHILGVLQPLSNKY